MTWVFGHAGQSRSQGAGPSQMQGPQPCVYSGHDAGHPHRASFTLHSSMLEGPGPHWFHSSRASFFPFIVLDPTRHATPPQHLLAGLCPSALYFTNLPQRIPAAGAAQTRPPPDPDPHQGPLTCKALAPRARCGGRWGGPCQVLTICVFIPFQDVPAGQAVQACRAVHGPRSSSPGGQGKGGLHSGHTLGGAPVPV